jgi:hypothetical protein
MAYVHRTLILPAAITANCQQLSEALSGPAGAGMWTTGLSADGASPATHFISSGMISEELAAVIAEPDVMFAACESAGLPVTLAQCQSILGAADVSEDEPFAALGQLGLKLIQSTTL